MLCNPAHCLERAFPCKDAVTRVTVSQESFASARALARPPHAHANAHTQNTPLTHDALSARAHEQSSAPARGPILAGADIFFGARCPQHQPDRHHRGRRTLPPWCAPVRPSPSVPCCAHRRGAALGRAPCSATAPEGAQIKHIPAPARARSMLP